VRIDLRTILKRMQSELRQTMVYVTHDQSESLTLADKIAVMDKGKLLQYDTPENIYESPTNTFVAWFIGNPGMNFINCRFEELNGKAYLSAKTFKYDITHLAKTVKKEASSDELILGIRPEHIQISLNKEQNWIKAKCMLTEPLGNRMIIHLGIGNQQVVKAKSPSLVDISPGDTVWINFPSDNIRVFDGESYNLIS
jgi:ABC-type sugar transport system ATPase subunit